MQEDKNLKNLLNEYAIQDTSSTFSSNVMEKITAASFIHQSKPLLNNNILNLLKIVFLIVLIALIIYVVITPFKNITVPFNTDIDENIYKQLFSFIIAFWTTIIINLWVNKRWNIEKSF